MNTAIHQTYTYIASPITNNLPLVCITSIGEPYNAERLLLVITSSGFPIALWPFAIYTTRLMVDNSGLTSWVTKRIVIILLRAIFVRRATIDCAWVISKLDKGSSRKSTFGFVNKA